MKRVRPLQRSQRGIALITAVLIVALATILATNVSFRGYLDQRRTGTQFLMDQGYEVGLGAEAWAADYLQQDFKSSKGGQVDFTQRWATPLPPIPIEGGELEGVMEDMQGRFNLNSLVSSQNNKADPDAVARLERLLQLIGLEPDWAQRIADWIDPDTDPEVPNGAEDSTYTSLTPSYLTANMPITRTSELLALKDFGIERFRKLEPFVSALPAGTTLNLCTAPVEVLDAFATDGQTEYSQSRENVTDLRKQRCFPSLSDYEVHINNLNASQKQHYKTQVIGITSGYFRASIFITIGSTQFTMYSLLKSSGQPGGSVTFRPILRSFGST